MREILARKKGITLIALVITIVIMLILASVTINMTIGERGIITRAKNAKIAVRLAEIRESIQVDLVTLEADNMFEEGLPSGAIVNILKKYGDVIYEDPEDENSAPVGVTAKDGGTVLDDIMLEDIYPVDVTPAPVITTITDVANFGPGKIKANSASSYVGKTINYVPQTDTSFTIPTYDGISISNASTESMTWKVLSEDNNGNLLITTTTPTGATITIGDSSNVETAAAAYNNAVQALNAYCRKYYSNTEKNAIARNLNMEDLEAHLTTEGKNARDTYSNYGATDINPSINSYRPEGYAFEKDGTKGMSVSLSSSDYAPYTQSETNVVTPSSNYGYNNTYYKFSNSDITSSAYFDANTESLLFTSTGYDSGFWLSSRCVRVDSDFARFEVRRVNDAGTLGVADVLQSGGSVDSYSFAFRPVVSILQSEIGSFSIN